MLGEENRKLVGGGAGGGQIEVAWATCLRHSSLPAKFINAASYWTWITCLTLPVPGYSAANFPKEPWNIAAVSWSWATRHTNIWCVKVQLKLILQKRLNANFSQPRLWSKLTGKRPRHLRCDHRAQKGMAVQTVCGRFPSSFDPEAQNAGVEWNCTIHENQCIAWGGKQEHSNT